jgi:hypothetical protein
LWRARKRMAWVRVHRCRRGLRVCDSGVDGSPRRSRHHLARCGRCLGGRGSRKG